MDAGLLRKLILNGTIFCGRKINEDRIVRFERLQLDNFEIVPENERAYATSSMGRAIFTIDKSGKIHNIKGVDSCLAPFEISVNDLVNADTIELDQGEDKYKVIAIVFNGENPEIRINGTSRLKDLEIEADVNYKLKQMGLKVPEITKIREFSQNYLVKYGLPIKVNGSNDDFISSFSEEDEQRKERLRKILGDRYKEDMKPGQRPENMKEFLQRIKFLESKEAEEMLPSLGYSSEDFYNAIDDSFYGGQRYGQEERLLGNPFRISDLEIYLKKNDVKKINDVFEFSKAIDENFESNLAKTYGKNIALLINNGWECEALMHRQDFSLSGEFCDDSYFDIIEYKKQLEKQYSDKLYIIDTLYNRVQHKFLGQIMHIGSCIKIVQDSMRTIGNDKENIDQILDDFIDSFCQNIDFKKIGNIFGLDKKEAKAEFAKRLLETKNWANYMADLHTKDEVITDKQVYNAHKDNEEFYTELAEEIAYRVLEKEKNKSKKIKQRHNTQYINKKANSMYEKVNSNGISSVISFFSKGKTISDELKYDMNEEYIKKLIIAELNVGSMILTHKYNDRDFDDREIFNKEVESLRNHIDNSHYLKFDEKRLDSLFGNSLEIESDEDYLEWLENLCPTKTTTKGINKIYDEEEFKYKYIAERNILKKITGFLKYKKLLRNDQLEDKYSKKIRQIIHDGIYDNPYKTYVACGSARSLLQKGLEEYSMNKEVEDITKMVLTSLNTKPGKMINIENVQENLRAQMNSKVSKVKPGIEYRKDEVVLGGNNLVNSKETYKPIPAEKIPEAIRNLQSEYEEAYNSKIDTESYIRKITEIYAKYMYIQPYEDGNKRTATCLFNSMLLSKGINPPPISLVNDEKMCLAFEKARDKDYTELQDLVIKKYKKLNESAENTSKVKTNDKKIINTVDKNENSKEEK